MRNYLVIILFLTLSGCRTKNNHDSEKSYENYDNIIKVDNIYEIKTDLLTKPLVFYIIDSFLIAHDMYNPIMGIHIFNKNNFKYITSTGLIGEGPGEIGRPGPIFIDQKNRSLLVGDWGKMVMWKFPLDSAIKNKNYKPTIKFLFPQNGPLLNCAIINDTILLGSSFSINPKNKNEPVLSLIKVDIKNQKIENFGYKHNKLNSLGMNLCRFNFALTDDKENYILAYKNLDLITICSKSGDLKFNIYGPQGIDMKNDNISTYYQIETFDKFIIIAYVGEQGSKTNSNKRREMVLPTKLVIFDREGNYIKTIDTGLGFFSYTYDKENKRIIAYFSERESPLGYFSLEL